MRLVTYRTPYPTRTRQQAVPAYQAAYQPIGRLYEEMNRLFEDGLGQIRSLSGEMSEFTPTIDVDQSDDAYTVTLEIPGVKRDDVSVEVREGMLVVSGTKNKAVKRNGQGEGESVQAARRFGRFSQAMTLPDDAVRDEISAEFADGVLHVSIPRDPEHGQNRTLRIEVRESSDGGGRGSAGSDPDGADARRDEAEGSREQGESKETSKDARQKDADQDARKDAGQKDAGQKDGK